MSLVPARCRILGACVVAALAAQLPAAPALAGADLPRPDPALEERYRERTGAAPLPSQTIPAVVERVQDIRIPVRAIEFESLPEYPRYGIDAAAVRELTESLRRRYAREDEVVSGGFTQSELEELGARLEALGGFDRPEALDANALQSLVATLQRQKRERGLSYSELEDIAAQVTRFYRERGLILARAYIPEQEVRDGVVTLAVLRGELGEVTVEGAQRYKPRRLAAVLDGQLGEAVHGGSVEQALYLLNDYPGLDVYGFFSPGDVPGQTRLNLQVRDERRWRMTLRGDNYGSRFTGDERGFLTLDMLNPTGIGDELSIGYLQSRAPVNSRLGVIRYSLPIAGPATRLQFSYDYNDFSLDDRSPELQLLDISGSNRSAEIGVRHQLRRGRLSNLALGLDLSDKKSSMDAAVSLPYPEEHVRAAEFSISGDVLSERLRMIHLGVLSLQYGDFVSDVAPGRDDRYYRIALDTASLMFLNLPWTDYETRLLLRSRMIHSNSALPAFEQMSLGGAQTVRAFSVSDFSVDSGAFLAAEWYLPMPSGWNVELPWGYRFNDVWQTALFIDGAYGIQNSFESGVSDSWAHFAGAGLLFKFGWDERFNVQASFARPVTNRSSVPGVGDRVKSLQTYLDFTWVMP